MPARNCITLSDGSAGVVDRVAGITGACTALASAFSGPTTVSRGSITVPMSAGITVATGACAISTIHAGAARVSNGSTINATTEAAHTRCWVAADARRHLST